MNARNQLLVVLTALMMACASGAMVAGAAPAAADDTEAVPDDHDTEPNDTADGPPENVTDEEEPIDDEPMNEETAETAPPEAAEFDAAITFSDQSIEDDTVVVDDVELEDGGFVVIHDSSLLVGNVIGSVIGVSEYLEPGEHENVEVALDEPLEEDETLIAMAHLDTNDDEAFDFVETDGEEDGPYLTPEDEPVTDRAVVTADPEAEPIEEEPVDEPDALEDDVIEVGIEQATVFVFVEPPDEAIDESDDGTENEYGEDATDGR
ncbi:hypothetical protein RBH26_16765 [Natronolimnohabitans sp. A-GB9]|uniref:DUF7282 domain-containing protein n=1 Tax=Natronolimnohabitans sp. A-GB9 TaxID=3069757 RepID=UPI0027AF5D41|nr:hypothetical protein [Natronolimnohabitans sp. A-GB9]MDQ2052132.1 hypothetical protein [Natronolimnohabitans sp. A-GB9]